MKMCRYLPASELPPLATKEELEVITNAISAGKVHIAKKPINQIIEVWKTNQDHYLACIARHIEIGFRVFRKKIIPPRADCIKFEANVSLEPESEEEADDIYIEITIEPTGRVYICNTHPHDDTRQRLPK